MFLTYTVVTVVTVAANVAIAVADLRHAPFVVANSAEVGVPQRWLPWLATLKGAGAAGLLIGLAGASSGRDLVAGLGLAAAVGLVLFYTAALIAHVRARVFYNIGFPAVFWLLAAASLALLMAVAP